MTKYIDDKGRLIFASAGLDRKVFMIMYKNAWENSGMHRLKVKGIPERDNLEDAQADLDAYAAKKGWETIDGRSVY